MQIWRSVTRRFREWTSHDREPTAAWLSLPTAEMGAPWACRQFIDSGQAEQDTDIDRSE
jgi:hypothetical protein